MCVHTIFCLSCCTFSSWSYLPHTAMLHLTDMYSRLKISCLALCPPVCMPLPAMGVPPACRYAHLQHTTFLPHRTPRLPLPTSYHLPPRHHHRPRPRPHPRHAIWRTHRRDPTPRPTARAPAAYHPHPNTATPYPTTPQPSHPTVYMTWTTCNYPPLPTLW